MNDVIWGKKVSGEWSANSKQVIEQYNRIVRLLNAVNNEVKILSYPLNA